MKRPQDDFSVFKATMENIENGVEYSESNSEYEGSSSIDITVKKREVKRYRKAKYQGMVKMNEQKPKKNNKKNGKERNED